MGHDTETREKLIESAKHEFTENGYNKASLRKICANADVTTGALYFFFKDKADLYRAIVGGFADGLFSIIKQHFDEEKQSLENEGFPDEPDDHSVFAQTIIHYIYQNYDAAMLILTKSQGSEYENILDRIVDMTENATMETLEMAANKKGGVKVNKYMVHLVTHIIIDAFVHMVTHEPDEQKALSGIKKVFKMTMHGWTDTILE